MINSRPKISVIVPVYNEEKYLGKFLPQIINQLEKARLNWQLIVSENGSSDQTLKIAHKLANQFEQVQVISSPTANYGLAVKKGFLAADGQYLVLFDLDYFNVGFVQKALLKMDKYDAIVGSKRDPRSKDARTFFRRIATLVFSLILKTFFGLEISDTHGIKILNRKKFLPLIKKSKMTKEIFDTELLLRGQKEGLSIGERPIKVEERRASRSSIIKRGFRTIKDLAKLKFIFIQETLQNQLKEDLKVLTRNTKNPFVIALHWLLVQIKVFIHKILKQMNSLIKELQKLTQDDIDSSQSLAIFGGTFPIVWTLTLIFLIVETYKFPGVFRVSHYLPLSLTIATGLAYFISPSSNLFKNDEKIMIILKKSSVGLFIISISIFTISAYLESINYPNYIFSNFHFHFDHSLNMAIHAILFYVFTSPIISDFLTKEKMGLKSEASTTIKKVITIMILIPLALVGFKNITETTPKIVSEVMLTYKFMNKSYDEKMSARWGHFYDYVSFVVDNTPQDAVIYHPPQIKPWEFTGNQVLLRYFLYPRKLVSGSIDFDEYDGEPITHVLIVWGRNSPGLEGLNFGWPDREFKAEGIKLMNQSDKELDYYSPDAEEFRNAWGIIVR